ncbi:hypothetical protein ACHAPA_004728 [Fusarium lateritium]
MFKQRSHDTHFNTHLPLITGNPRQYTTALLGSSLMERFKTTGANLSINRNPQILNLGVSGDKIQNAQYRVNQGLGLRAELPEAMIVTTALFVQRELEVRVIEQANNSLGGIAAENGCEVLPFGDQRGMMGRDKVHPNLAGYTKRNDMLEDDMKSR